MNIMKACVSRVVKRSRTTRHLTENLRLCLFWLKLISLEHLETLWWKVSKYTQESEETTTTPATGNEAAGPLCLTMQPNTTHRPSTLRRGSRVQTATQASAFRPTAASDTVPNSMARMSEFV